MGNQRLELLAANLANADTPDYKARDIDFRSAMQEADQGVRLAATRAGHIGTEPAGPRATPLYRVSDQPSRDGNTVDAQEMGLLEEAAGEFRMAMKRRDLLVGSSSLLADTLSEQGDLDVAAAVLEEVLAADGLSDEERRDIRYHKAMLLSRGGREGVARGIFLALYEEMPGYRDVKARTERYRS